MLPSGVAAGHPATVAAGIEILEEGGTAADAAVAACLASCVAETVMTGLLGGGHAIYWDGERGVEPRLLRRRALGRRRAPVELKVPFGEELVHYAVGPGHLRRPGASARARRALARASAACRGSGSSSRRSGSRATASSCLPPTPPASRCWRRSSRCSPTASASTRPRGRLLEQRRGARRSRASRRRSSCVAAEGADSFYRGSIAEALLGGRRDAGDGGRSGALRGALGRAGRGRVRRDARS